MALAAIAALGSTSAQAQDSSYYYYGFGIGQARATVDDGAIAAALAGSGLTINAVSHEERESTYKLFGGYQFNRHIGLELGYFDMGRFGFRATTTPPGTLSGNFRVQGGNLDLVGTLPLAGDLSALARIGMQYARTWDEISSSGAVVVTNTNPSDHETNVKVGLGLQYAFSPGFLLRGEVEAFRLSDGVGHHPNVTTYLISAVFPFGRAATPVRQAAVAPAYVPITAVAAPMQAPEPVVAKVTPEVPAPVAKPMGRVSYAAESFFVFDRSELQAPGKTALDTFAAQLRGATYDTITVQGYADRLGTTAYNQTLSLARVDAVKAYLISSANLDGDKIKTIGRSESDPVTLPDQCKGPQSAAVIACLQPDRRVELEVIGWR